MARECELITPETKVGDLLDSYPELEDVLLELSPAFKKLKNPVLRKTVARVTSLRHAAKVGGLSIGELVNHLRRFAGIEEVFTEETAAEDSAQLQPAWMSEYEIVQRLDVRPLLESGEKPVGRVMKELSALGSNRIYQMTAPFVPAPLIDMAQEKGFASWVRKEREDLVEVFFCRALPGLEENPPLVNLD